MLINFDIDVAEMLPQLRRVIDLSGDKILRLEKSWKIADGAPVFTVDGVYVSRGWTEWTQGFQFGSALLQFDATGDQQFLEIGRRGTLAHMANHLSATGVHDHGFNNVSTYGNLLRLMNEGRIPATPWEKSFYELALRVSGAVQAARWTDLGEQKGYIYSFNGPHSLFADTVRSLRALALAHQLGQVLASEHDERISLLTRLIAHADATSKYNVYFGEGRDIYDVRGRVAHESIFNLNDKSYRCPSSQQGYSPFSTWTRGLAWIICGYAELLEFLKILPAEEFAPNAEKQGVLERFERTADATADFYIENTASDGIPYWDTGAPGISHMGQYLDAPADPFNAYEPVDSSAAVIAAQGLIRLGMHYNGIGKFKQGRRYLQAGLTTARSVFADLYLSQASDHQGLLLHSVYHRPNGWDHIRAGEKVPCGEATMWGDYHARELAVILLRMAEKKPYHTFFIQPSQRA